MGRPVAAPGKIRATCPSADSFIMHPLLAEVHHGVWSSPTCVPGGEDFELMVSRREGSITLDSLDYVAYVMYEWMARHKVDVSVTRRALVDVARRRLWSVDFVCGIGGRCWLVCLFVREEDRLDPEDIAFARRVRWLAHARYRSAVGVAAVCVGARGKVLTLWLPP